MGPRNKAVALLMAVVMACTSFAAAAQQVDTSLSANPTATISTIDSIGTPLSNQEASGVRGTGFLLDWADYFRSVAGAFGVTAAVTACVIVTGGVCGYAAAAAGGYFLFTGYVLPPLSEAVYVNARY